MKIDPELRNAGNGGGNNKNKGNMQVVQGLLVGVRMNGNGSAIGAGGYFEGGRPESMANNLYY